MTALVDRDEAIRLLKVGGVVAVPTDTVYGIAASLAHPRALQRLFEIKRRPTTTALPILVDSQVAIERLGVDWPAGAQRLSEAFWPGALTIVVAVPHELATLVGSTRDTAGFRIPRHELLRDVLIDVGPLAVSSANEHGEAPCRSAAAVLNAFVGREELDGVLEGGEGDGEVSTVVGVDDASWRVLRHGALDTEDLARALE
ncbi:MAG TPA: L-threonylcarbamoyladenylate synthase [Acidimicrobiales bacterium]|nr:L-threonylcarbamoyladenylate synthase [Acidimicrobiales bacterium]